MEDTLLACSKGIIRCVCGAIILVRLWQCRGLSRMEMEGGC